MRVCRDTFTRESLGYAYANYSTQQGAENALRTLNYTMINDKEIRIMWAQKDPTLRKTGIGNVFISGLDKGIDNKCFYDTFSAFGRILSSKVRHEPGRSYGVGYVHFQTIEAAIRAIEKVNGKQINGRIVSVEHYRKPRKKKVPEEFEDSSTFTNVYIRNLRKDINKLQLQNYLSKYGTIQSLRLVTAEKKRPTGIAYCNFETHEYAKKCIEELNESEEYARKGQKLLVCRFMEKKKRMQFLREKSAKEGPPLYKNPGTNIYVKNLGNSVDEDELRKMFSEFGTITSCAVMRDEKTGLSKGFGFVNFTLSSEATRAINTISGQKRRSGRRPLYVALAQPKEVRKQQNMLKFQRLRGRGAFFFGGRGTGRGMAGHRGYARWQRNRNIRTGRPFYTDSHNPNYGRGVPNRYNNNYHVSSYGYGVPRVNVRPNYRPAPFNPTYPNYNVYNMGANSNPMMPIPHNTNYNNFNYGGGYNNTNYQPRFQRSHNYQRVSDVPNALSNRKGPYYQRPNQRPNVAHFGSPVSSPQQNNANTNLRNFGMKNSFQVGSTQVKNKNQRPNLMQTRVEKKKKLPVLEKKLEEEEEEEITNPWKLVFESSSIVLCIMKFLDRGNLSQFFRANKSVYEAFSGMYKKSMERKRVNFLNVRSLFHSSSQSTSTYQILSRTNRASKFWSERKSKKSKRAMVANFAQFEKNLNRGFLGNELVMKEIVSEVLQGDYHGFFYLGGSSLTYSLQYYDFKSDVGKIEVMKRNGTYKNADLDFFLISTLSPKKKKKMLLMLLQKLKPLITYDFVVLYTQAGEYSTDMLSLIPREKDRFRTIQFVLRDVQSIEEFLLFTDLDCSRFLYDGKRVFGTTEALNSLKYKSNVLPRFTYSLKHVSRRRVQKYLKRGFRLIDGELRSPILFKTHPETLKRLKNSFALIPKDFGKKNTYQKSSEFRFSRKIFIAPTVPEDFIYEKKRVCTKNHIEILEASFSQPDYYISIKILKEQKKKFPQKSSGPQQPFIFMNKYGEKVRRSYIFRGIEGEIIDLLKEETTSFVKDRMIMESSLVTNHSLVKCSVCDDAYVQQGLKEIDRNYEKIEKILENEEPLEENENYDKNRVIAASPVPSLGVECLDCMIRNLFYSFVFDSIQSHSFNPFEDDLGSVLDLFITDKSFMFPTSNSPNEERASEFYRKRLCWIVLCKSTNISKKSPRKPFKMIHPYNICHMINKNSWLVDDFVNFVIELGLTKGTLKLLDNRSVVLEAVKKNPRIFNFVDEVFKNDSEILECFICSRFLSSLQDIPDTEEGKMMAMEAVKKDFRLLESIDLENFRDGRGRDIVLAAVSFGMTPFSRELRSKMTEVQ